MVLHMRDTYYVNITYGTNYQGYLKHIGHDCMYSMYGLYVILMYVVSSKFKRLGTVSSVSQALLTYNVPYVYVPLLGSRLAIATSCHPNATFRCPTISPRWRSATSGCPSSRNPCPQKMTRPTSLIFGSRRKLWTTRREVPPSLMSTRWGSLLRVSLPKGSFGPTAKARDWKCNRCRHRRWWKLETLK